MALVLQFLIAVIFLIPLNFGINLATDLLHEQQ